MNYSTGMLTNLATCRFHPISFRMAPLPGGSDIPRYKSVGQHTVGFDTIEEANAWIRSNENTIFVQNQYGWDDEDVPAVVDFFSHEMLSKLATEKAT